MKIIRRIHDLLFSDIGLNMHQMRAGDIILTGERTRNSRFIRFMTSSKYSHALIYAGNGMAYEAVPDGVNLVPVGNLFFSKKNCSVLRWEKYVTHRQSETIMNYLRSQIGVQYSKPEAAKSWRLFSFFYKMYTPTNKQFCSRLVCRAYEEAGLVITKNINFTNPKHLKTIRTKIVSDAVRKIPPAKYSLHGFLFDAEDNIRKIGQILHEIRCSSDDYSEINASELKSYFSQNTTGELNSRVRKIASSMKCAGFTYQYYLDALTKIRKDVCIEICEMIVDGFEENLRITVKLLNDLDSEDGNIYSDPQLTNIKKSLQENILILSERNLAAFQILLKDGNISARGAEAYGFNDAVSNLVIKGLNRKILRLGAFSMISSTLEDILEVCSQDEKVDQSVTAVLTTLMSKKTLFLEHEDIFITRKNGYPNKFTRETCFAINSDSEFKSTSSGVAVLLMKRLYVTSISEFSGAISKPLHIQQDLTALEPRDVFFLMWQAIREKLDPDVSEREFQSRVEIGRSQHSNTFGISQPNITQSIYGQ